MFTKRGHFIPGHNVLDVLGLSSIAQLDMTQAAAAKQQQQQQQQHPHHNKQASLPQKQPHNTDNHNPCEPTVQSSAPSSVKCQHQHPPNHLKDTTGTASMTVCPLAGLSLAAFLLPSLALLFCSLPLGTPLGLVAAIVFAQLLVRQLPTLLTALSIGARYVTLVDTSSMASRKSILHSHVVALLLGLVLKVGIDLIICEQQQQLLLLGIYLVLLSLFHFGEYFVTALTNPQTLDLNSYLLNNSLAYTLAISLSFVEFLIEVYLFPSSKPLNAIALLGLSVAIFGETIRKLAMFTAGTNFSHMISTSKSSSHQLVTHGVYSIFRHPSYAGWFYWAVGTQILLQNPICFVIFNLAACQFFRERINYEEELLTEFFGKDYDNYREKVKLWMPI